MGNLFKWGNFGPLLIASKTTHAKCPVIEWTFQYFVNTVHKSKVISSLNYQKGLALWILIICINVLGSAK